MDINTVYFVGDTPPAYPNGWFGIVESRSLKKGEVQHVTALGKIKKYIYDSNLLQNIMQFEFLRFSYSTYMFNSKQYFFY